MSDFYRNARREGLAEGRAEGLELGREEGRAEGREEGRKENRLDSIAAIMRNGNMSAQKAMDILSIPVEERNELLGKLE